MVEQLCLDLYFYNISVIFLPACCLRHSWDYGLSDHSHSDLVSVFEALHFIILWFYDLALLEETDWCQFGKKMMKISVHMTAAGWGVVLLLFQSQTLLLCLIYWGSKERKWFFIAHLTLVSGLCLSPIINLREVTLSDCVINVWTGQDNNFQFISPSITCFLYWVF